MHTHDAKDIEQYLDILLDAAQANRIQQVQATYADPSWSLELRAMGDRAWRDLNIAHRELTALLGAERYDRLFRRRGVSGDENPWRYPERLGDRILFCLFHMRVRVVGRAGGAIIIEVPYGEPGGYDWWALSDNGGELMCSRINDKESDQLPGIACVNDRLRGTPPMQWACTVATWVYHRITGREGGPDYARYDPGGEGIDLMEEWFRSGRPLEE